MMMSALLTAKGRASMKVASSAAGGGVQESAHLEVRGLRERAKEHALPFLLLRKK